MDYESLLNEAYSNIKEVTTECSRFEIKKPEGHFEGNKTIITNFFQIATCLRREPEHLAKFISKQLATPGEMDGERFIFMKKIPSIKICEKINQYSEEFVICPSCKKPDTEIIELNDGRYLKCLACGSKKKISN